MMVKHKLNECVDIIIHNPENYESAYERQIWEWWIFGRYQFRKSWMKSKLQDDTAKFPASEAIWAAQIGAIKRHWEVLDEMLKSPISCCAQSAIDLAHRIAELPEQKYGKLRGIIWKVMAIWKCRKQILEFVSAIRSRS